MIVRSASNRRFVLLDRDGTIIVERHYLADPDGVELLEGAIEGLHHMRDLGLGLVVVTNQSGVGRGYFDVERVEMVHFRLRELLAGHGIYLDGIYFCPHTPDDGCDCRKPRPGLVHRASIDLHFDPQATFVIGDKPCDIELGRRLRATTVLVKTGYGADASMDHTVAPELVADDLQRAAQLIEDRLGQHSG
jgi:D-glycero-D-manno-heptose 1,7-bisphosphate phosphatase